MSWDFTADDLRKELKELKEKLAVQGVKVGEQETKLLKYEEELKISRENCIDALSKLRREADRRVELEEALKRRTEELRNEKYTRENVEGALRLAKEEREREAASAREAHHYLNQAAVESNDYRTEQERTAAEKAKLEAQVRELQGELRRYHVAPPPPPPKTPARPRSSSLTNLNKVAMLERDIEKIRASASAFELDLQSTQNKLSRVQSDLIRTENERDAIEKRLKVQEQKVKDVLSEKDDLQVELQFYREQGGSSREDELMERLEEEEAKVALLEKQLSQSCSSGASRRAVEQLQARLNDEVSRRENLEAREIQLVQDREEAFNELDNLKKTFEQLEESVVRKELNLSEVESRCRSLQQQLDDAHRAASHAAGVDEEKIKDMVNCIARVRAERDELRAHLEFVQTEAHFKVESLENKLASQALNTPDPAHLQEYHQVLARLNDELESKKRSYFKLQTALQAMIITVQHLPVLDLSARIEEVNRLVIEHKAAIAAKDEELSEFKLRLSDTSSALRKEEGVRSALEAQVRQLEVDLSTVKQELADTSEHCERLEARLSTGASRDAITRSLKSEVEELRNRIMRRTEQIGFQQHDIKRLETNMRLTEERLEEAIGELELAETAKAAMIEDCSNAREERDEAKKALMNVELEAEKLSSQIKQREREAGDLRSALAAMEESGEKANATKDNESLLVAQAIAERDVHIKALTERLEATTSALRQAEEQSASLGKDIEELRQVTCRSVDDLHKQMQSKETAVSEELERRAQELLSLTKELDSSRLALDESRSTLEAKNTECRRAQDEIEALSAELASLKAGMAPYDERVAHQETKEALLAKEEELKQKTEDLRRLMTELDATKASREESVRMLESKKEELTANSAELKRILSEIDARNKEHGVSLEAKEARLAEMNEMAARLETEKRDLQIRLAAFEAETDKELADATSLRSVLEEERKRSDQQIQQLEAELASLRAEKADQVRASEAVRTELFSRCEETLALLETTKKELQEKQVLCDTLADERRKAADCRDDEAADLKKQLADLTTELESLRKSLEEEIDDRNRETTAHQEELQAALERQESLSAVESELRRTVDRYRQQLEEVRANLMTLQDENTTLQSDLDNLSSERTRTSHKSQTLERQLASNERELSDLRDEMSRLREALSKSERSGKAAEMNLLLISQQHERTISSLRSQLKEREKDSERIQKLQQIVGETREQIGEMEGLLKDRCAEIEENDDKFIQMLKEKKKLTSKVESLTKKNNALQKKLSAANAETPVVKSPPPELPARRRSAAMDPAQSTSKSTVSFTPAPPAASSLPAVKLESLESKRALRPPPTEAPRETRRVSGSKRRRESSPPLDEIPTSTSIGKKRPLPDDSDSGCAPVEARLPDAFKPGSSSSSALPAVTLDFEAPLKPLAPELTTTPRKRRTAPHSGFTPVRGQSTTLRPFLSQPSPVKRSAASRALQSSTVISDITNSPPRSKRLFTKEPGNSEPRMEKPAGKGWLGKIRGRSNLS